jgi:hypothetical protein
MHHPDGMLWIRMPGTEPRRHERKVPLAAVAPTLLQLLSLPAPPPMGRPIALAAEAPERKEAVPA